MSHWSLWLQHLMLVLAISYPLACRSSVILSVNTPAPEMPQQPAYVEGNGNKKVSLPSAGRLLKQVDSHSGG